MLYDAPANAEAPNPGKCDLVFQTLSWYASDEVVSKDEEEDDDEQDEDEDGHSTPQQQFQRRSYSIKTFGTMADGRAAALTILNFTPFFYMRVEPQPTAAQLQLLTRWMKRRDPKWGVNGHDIIDVRTLRKKDFWGFTNNKEKQFVRVTCQTLRTMRTLCDRLSKLPHKTANIPGISKELRVTLYESNIDPMIRFFHVRDVMPAGWLRVPAAKYWRGAPTCLAAKCDLDFSCKWQDCCAEPRDEIAPLLVASFDIECSSSHGDFPVAKKDYRKVAQDLVQLFSSEHLGEAKVAGGAYAVKERLIDAMIAPFVHLLPDAVLSERPGAVELSQQAMARVYPKNNTPSSSMAQIPRIAKRLVDDVYLALQGKAPPTQKQQQKSEGEQPQTQTLAAAVAALLTQAFGTDVPLQGDKVIQIGTTFHKYGSREVCYKVIVTLGTCDGFDGATVIPCTSEKELLTTWAGMMSRLDPDIVVGWNIFGFDMEYIHDRAEETDCVDFVCRSLSRLQDVEKPQRGRRWLQEQRLSSSALGDNFLRYVEMHGRTLIDLMKVVQRDHKLDSYKLDTVSQHFLGQRKNDVAPSEIFKLQKGSSADRRIIAEYCVQDCALCNYLTIKLEIVANNMGMANVCSVPFSFIFMRGQGVKIFSLVAKQCKQDGFLIPTVKFAGHAGNNTDDDGEAESEGYEGAIVLDPKPGIYLEDPVAVLDYASLYPSSMISENLSHDCYVMDPAYDNLPGVEYLTVTYEEGARTVSCRFAQIEGKGVLPRILMQLLKQRKATRKRMESVIVTLLFPTDSENENDKNDKNKNKDLQGFYDAATGRFTDLSGAVQQLQPGLVSKPAYTPFQQAVLDGLQLAYKVTANSLYGQMGARTSPLYLKQIAACTTATGRKMILMAKSFLEENYGADVVYGDTDSIFVVFPKNKVLGASGVTIAATGHAAIMPSIELAMRASKDFKKCLKPPHDLEYEKTFWPWIIFSKKRYVGNLYEFDDVKYKQKSMGIALKRRDNAPIVKKIYGGCLDIVLSEQDIGKSLLFLERELQDLVDGKTSLEDLIVTKTLRAEYKNPDQIAHQVLARRMGERDPGNKPQVNERVPYVYIEVPKDLPASAKKVLQGDRIEHPDYVRTNITKVKPDYRFYITNQIMKPVTQLYALALENLPVIAGLPLRRSPDAWQEERARLMLTYAGDSEKVDDKIQALKEVEAKTALFDPMLRRLDNKLKKNSEITRFFQHVSK
jgi:DNA polymerase elongation subunit (family B)